MAETITWYLGASGPYGSGAVPVDGDVVIPTPPGSLDDYRYNENGGVWVPKSQQEKDGEKDNRADNSLNGNKHTRALELLIGELHGLTEQEVRTMLKAHYKAL